MRIAQISPLWERVPPPRYGGIELIVHLLTDELVRRGHDVTLFASGDSITKAKLKSVNDQATRLDPKITEPSVYEQMILAEAYHQADEFDIIHSHIDFLALPYASFVKTPTVHTTHGIFTRDKEKIYRRFAWQPLISISEDQREPRLGLNYIHTVYNGIDTNVYSFHSKPAESPYLAFVGRMSHEKGPVEAIKIARAAGLPLKMAGKVDSFNEEYYRENVEPLIDGEQIQYLGEVSHEEKVKLLGEATVTLFPITWREPFGLVMIESMATGTPVVAMGLGSVPEVVAHGKTGYICHSVENMIEVIPDAIKLDRHTCREYVLNRFSVQSMADEYEKAYKMVLG
ncbi:glycosyltransferase family 4 protein [Aetokthonos hydrillicola Thurmond2011]|jgi:glycosyltransferase involved in cell wall biosynthesis|uniref:Glycosyltransferase family 4 protein n=1 Tax=Aetokthonos hydrillicola Thurmond2011 TaxID=2712845 RepID=A0AAP5MB04_9CYAN|nr:glycosyltransferase family 4 protein [Aetokthonos hydrillicola]MBW4585356.1 glycosyltransferase family 4 protein [Aetokthonos hydrillicola CCALA 1050]MDR9896508.1 glycosyltransferase family 4 protein [Aetokthonos hydrillicola Thurmond2011]